MIGLNIIPGRVIFKTRSILISILSSLTLPIAIQFLLDLAHSGGQVFREFCDVGKGGIHFRSWVEGGNVFHYGWTCNRDFLNGKI